MWFSRQDKANQDKLRRLVKSGQFEVASGAWTSPDEATVSFEDMLDNFIIGHQFLHKELDAKPKIGWNLDVKGHSAAATRLNA